MVDLNTYRQRIGGFNPYCKRSKRGRIERKGRRGRRCHVDLGGDQASVNNICIIIYYIFVLYVMMLGLSVTIDCTAGNCGYPCENGSGGVHSDGDRLSSAHGRLPSLSIVHIKIAYFVLLGFICRRFISLNSHNENYTSIDISILTIMFFGKRTSKISHFSSGLLLAISLIHFSR